MANLDDLGFSSITSKSLDENLEIIRQLRQARHIKTTNPKPAKSLTSTSSSPKSKSKELSSEQAARLLKMLTGE
jgi:hypothetical protein